MRTPVAKRGGDLASIHPADLGAHVIRSVFDRVDVDPGAVDDVVFGCLDQLGSQSSNIARTSWLAAGLPEEVPGVTVDRQCGSSQQAVQFAVHAVLSGMADLVVAGGVQSMSTVPISAAFHAGRSEGYGEPFVDSIGWKDRYASGLRRYPGGMSQFAAADWIAAKWGISRYDMESFAFQSHRRAVRAIDEGRFEREIAPIGGVAVDTCPRRDTTMDKMATLETLPGCEAVTAAVSSQNSDGAAAVLVANDRAVRTHNLTPRARIHHVSCRGSSPLDMLTAPIPATKYALRKIGKSLDCMDVVEVNEAFSSVVLAWAKELCADLEKVNINGGAIALGHPLGATGARLMTTLLHELERSDKQFGLQTMCEGGGLANVTVIERIG
ncbi:acetyl-CoA C-acetyltransferase [Mycobacteroides chelonae]|nr:acetyl-CoA C-acetyltransferase [Mycobacteroides chelonae]